MQIRSRTNTSWAYALVAISLACGSSGSDDDDTSMGADGSSAAEGATTHAHGSSDTHPTTQADGASSESSAEELHPCGLADLKASAADPIVSGTAAMQIPPDIAAIQVGNCGCHLADDLDVDAPDYPSTGAFDMTTWAGFQEIREGDQMPYHAIALANVMTEFMPLSSYCDIGGGLKMPADERATLVEWLTQGAPDGATWMP
jgi:hypothetical protein